jgi:hypothetical protein
MTELIVRHVAGETEGIDPRTLSPKLFGDLPGPLAAIRAKCVDCSGGSYAEARKCTATGCPLWPYRMGTNPRRKGAGNKNPQLTSRFSEARASV